MTSTEKNELRSVIELTAKYKNTYWLNRLAGIVSREFSRHREPLTAWIYEWRHVFIYPAFYLWGLAAGLYAGWVWFK